MTQFKCSQQNKAFGQTCQGPIWINIQNNTLYEIKSSNKRSLNVLNVLTQFAPFLTKSIIQGQSRQTGFFELALRDRNMQVRFIWKLLSKSRDLRNFASVTSFHEMYNVRHLWPNLQTWEKKFWKKDFECYYCKAIFQ